MEILSAVWPSVRTGPRTEHHHDMWPLRCIRLRISRPGRGCVTQTEQQQYSHPAHHIDKYTGCGVPYAPPPADASLLAERQAPALHTGVTARSSQRCAHRCCFEARHRRWMIDRRAQPQCSVWRVATRSLRGPTHRRAWCVCVPVHTRLQFTLASQMRRVDILNCTGTVPYESRCYCRNASC